MIMLEMMLNAASVVPMMPTLAPLRKKMRMMVPFVAPMVRRMAMSRPLSLTSMIMLEMMLNAATTMMRVRIRNMTLRSTWMALKKLALACCQSWTRPLPPMAFRMSLPTASARSGSSTNTSRLVTAPGRRKYTWAAPRGRKTNPESYSYMPISKVAAMR